jgi:hypothetical protein
MKLYSFASEDLTNIWAGIGAGMWAVGESDKPAFVKGRNTKAARMPIAHSGFFIVTTLVASPCRLLSIRRRIPIVSKLKYGLRLGCFRLLSSR